MPERAIVPAPCLGLGFLAQLFIRQGLLRVIGRAASRHGSGAFNPIGEQIVHLEAGHFIGIAT